MRYPFPITPATQRVVVTGAGIVTAHGVGWHLNRAGFQSGQTRFTPVRLFDVSRQRAQLAAQVELPEDLPQTRLSPRTVSRMDRAARMLLLAPHEALHTANWDAPPRSLPIVIGTTSAGMPLGEAYYRHATARPFTRNTQPSRVVHYLAQRQVQNLVEGFALPAASVQILANACASAANAVGHAFHLVRSGQATHALTGGYDALCQLVFAGFDSLQALSPTVNRPFDVARDGLGLGEGAAVLAIESLESAKRRQATVLGEIVGYGFSTDRHHLTQPHPDGVAACRAMSMAARDAQITPDQIDYLNAHGTGTAHNDSSEAVAISRWAGIHAASLPVSSTKASIGHLLGAAGAVETVVCLMALAGGWLPPMTTTTQPDSLCTFPLVTRPANKLLEYALTNSFGFGGSNASLILRRWHE